MEFSDLQNMEENGDDLLSALKAGDIASVLNLSSMEVYFC